MCFPSVSIICQYPSLKEDTRFYIRTFVCSSMFQTMFRRDRDIVVSFRASQINSMHTIKTNLSTVCCTGLVQQCSYDVSSITTYYHLFDINMTNKFQIVKSSCNRKSTIRSDKNDKKINIKYTYNSILFLPYKRIHVNWKSIFIYQIFINALLDGLVLTFYSFYNVLE